MSLIRCLGPITLPLSYRKFMRRELDLYNRKVILKPGYDTWHQDIVLSKYENSFISGYGPVKDHWFKNLRLTNEKPLLSSSLSKRLGQIFKGEQTHVCMTLNACLDHEDDFDDLIDTALIIPYKTSSRHALIVENECRLLKNNHIYAFNQKLTHRLDYMNREDGEESTASAPCSLLSISFRKLRSSK